MKRFKFKNDTAGAGTIEYVVLAATAVLIAGYVFTVLGARVGTTVQNTNTGAATTVSSVQAGTSSNK